MSVINENQYKMLINEAFKIREKAYCPYSHFAVGAALLTADYKVYTGCNIENSAGTSNCAERTAIFKAVSEGKKDFIAIAIIGGPSDKKDMNRYCYPCGICRQVMSEFCDEKFQIICAKSDSDYEIHTLSEMLPYSFDFISD